MELKRRAHDLLLQNRRIKNGHQYTVPSPTRYPHQWLWDSCFHAIVLSHLEPEAAKAEIRSLLARQLPDGMIPHMIFWRYLRWPPYTWGWGRRGTSSITQPPMIAYAALQIHRQNPDPEFLKEIYPKLMAFYRYIISERDPMDHHLSGIINPDESGEDNSPRFDEPMKVPASIGFYEHILRRWRLVWQNKACNFDAELCMSETFWVKDVPFNTILAKNLEALAEISRILDNKDGERYANLRRSLLIDAMRERMFGGGVFWSTMGHDYKRLNVATWAHFVPLFAGLYTKEEATAVIKEHLYNEQTFRGQFGIRTTSKLEKAYRQDGFWRGPVWMAPHWFIYKGLMDYGFKKEAEWIKERSIHLIERNGFREYFDPETGEGYGARSFTWGTLILDME